MSESERDVIRVVVSEAESGTRLDRFLALQLGSRAGAQRAIDAGRVSVSGQLRPKRHLLSAEEVIEIRQPAPSKAGARISSGAPFSVGYEDEYLLVVDKPAGVVVHPARGHSSGTLAQALRLKAAGGEDPARAGIVHRLDRDTSGLLVVARTEQAHRQLKALLGSRRLHREYAALVQGRPAARTGTIEAPIGRDRRNRLLMSVDSDSPRPARTHFELEEPLPSSSLLKVVLDTGRTHQIRVHLAAIGHPVCGDPLYGTSGLYGLGRQFLHARRLTFPHPVTGEEIDVVSKLPDDLERALQLARDR